MQWVDYQHNARQGLRWEQRTSLEELGGEMQYIPAVAAPLGLTLVCWGEATWPRVRISVLQAPSSPQSGPCFTLCSRVPCLCVLSCFVLLWSTLKAAGNTSPSYRFQELRQHQKKWLRWGKPGPSFLPLQLTAFCCSLGINRGTDFLLKGFWAVIKGSFEKEPIITLSIISLLKHDP